MQSRIIFTGMLLTQVFIAQSCSDRNDKKEIPMDDQVIRRELSVLQHRRIFFGHQSVGANVVTGLKEILAWMPDIHLTMTTLAEAGFPSGPCFVDTYIGENSKPKSKCDAFAVNVKALSDSLDIALMKFCYVDLTEGTDVQDLFAYYRNTIAELELTCPGVTFVHVTVPLTRRGASWKILVKHVLGKEEYNDRANLKRAEFNRLLLEFYKDETVFDLAAIESTFPDGRRNSFESEGRTGFSLIREYADDGDHLGVQGRQRAARELIRALAAAGGRPRGK